MKKVKLDMGKSLDSKKYNKTIKREKELSPDRKKDTTDRKKEKTPEIKKESKKKEIIYKDPKIKIGSGAHGPVDMIIYKNDLFALKRVKKDEIKKEK
jgi:hypothetical protein